MISEERLDQICIIVARAGLSAQTLTALREALPEIHFTQCLDDDIVNQTPVRSGEEFNLYLVEGSSGHCLALTQDVGRATGVVIAEVDPEDE